MPNEVEIKRECTGRYTVTYNGKTLWIKHNYGLGVWVVEQPWAFKQANGTYKSKRLDCCLTLTKAKERAAHIIKDMAA